MIRVITITSECRRYYMIFMILVMIHTLCNNIHSYDLMIEYELRK